MHESVDFLENEDHF